MLNWLSRLISVKDSRQRESTTLGFVSIAFLVVVGKFALGGFFGLSEMSGVDFGVAIGAVLGIWLGREWADKSSEAKVEAAKITAKAEVKAAAVVAEAKVDESSEDVEAHEKAATAQKEAAVVQAKAAKVQKEAAEEQTEAAAVQKRKS